MPTSALLGHPPTDAPDAHIIEGWWRFRFRHFGPGLPKHPPLIPVQTPSEASHHSRQGEVIAVMSVIVALIVTITGTRLALRYFKKHLRWGADDTTIAIAAVTAVAYSAVVISSTQNAGVGKHLYDVTYAELEIWTTDLAVGPILFYLSLGLIKISICLFNRRLTGLTSRKWMIYHYVLLTGVIIFMLAVLFGYVFMCLPVWPLFRLSKLGARDYDTHCLDQNAITQAFSILHVIFDFFLLPVPLIVMKHVRMSFWQRVRLGCLFSIGAISFVGAVMRTVVLRTVQTDITYQFPDFNRWSVIDLIFAVAVASLPTLNALLPKSWRRRAHSDPQPLAPHDVQVSPEMTSKESKTEVVVVMGSDDSGTAHGCHRNSLE